MHQLHFTLKQHTPIIHFQHTQDGATLRATEVKPKLDRFIIEQCELTEMVTINNIQKEVPKMEFRNLFIGGGKHHLALDYKMRITGEVGTDQTIFINYTRTNDGKFRPNFPTLFGNVEESQKKVFKLDRAVKLSIFTFRNELVEYIKKCIDQFFFENNFGFRQSKGFGNFSPKNYTPTTTEAVHFSLKYSESEYKNVFADIDLFYRCLKSGLNIKIRENPHDRNSPLVDKMYFKSLMFKFAKNLKKPEQWDKRTLRHELYKNHHLYKDDRNDSGVFYNRKDKEGTVHFTSSKPEDGTFFDFRDLLGLATEMDWRFYSGDTKVTKSVTGKFNNSTEPIERFSSPLLIKPYYIPEQQCWQVYIITQKISKAFLGAEVKAKNRTNATKLKIYPNFLLNDYLTFAIQSFDENDITYGNGFDKHIEEAQSIIKIFKQLKMQIPV